LNSWKISSINLKIDSVSLKIGIIIVNLFISKSYDNLNLN